MPSPEISQSLMGSRPKDWRRTTHAAIGSAKSQANRQVAPRQRHGTTYRPIGHSVNFADL